MDLASVATDLSSSSVAQSANVGVLKAVQKLDAVVGAQLAASLGLGNSVDAYA
jgi:hypothetical protein